MPTVIPTGTVNSEAEAGMRVPGGPSGNVDVTVMANAPVNAKMATACPKCNAVRARFHVRRPTSLSGVTPGAMWISEFMLVLTSRWACGPFHEFRNGNPLMANLFHIVTDRAAPLRDHPSSTGAPKV